MKVRFTPSARSQFFAGLEYIKANNPLAALALLARAKKSLRRLSTYPQSGRKIPEFPELALSLAREASAAQVRAW